MSAAARKKPRPRSSGNRSPCEEKEENEGPGRKQLHEIPDRSRRDTRACLVGVAGWASAQTPASPVKLGVLTEPRRHIRDVSGKGSVLAAQMADRGLRREGGSARRSRLFRQITEEGPISPRRSPASGTRSRALTSFSTYRVPCCFAVSGAAPASREIRILRSGAPRACDRQAVTRLRGFTGTTLPIRTADTGDGAHEAAREEVVLIIIDSVAGEFLQKATERS